MAAFSIHHHGTFTTVSDSVYVPNTASNNMSTSSPSTSTCFSPIYPSKYLHQTPLKQVSKSSPMAPELESGDEATQVVTQLEKKRKAMASVVEGGGKCQKGKKFEDGMSEIVEEKKMKAGRNKDKKQVSEEAPPPPPTGYVHVRARRGQATDSHSLAERVRREKISERMKLLQSLVPGCDRITGKALVLDEIINYVQSLQNQVEFLVRKLASVYPDFFNYLDAHSPAPALERPLSSGPQSESMELGAGAGAAPTSTFFSLEPDNTSIFYSLDDEELLGNIDDQIQMLANNFGLDNLHSF